MHPIQKEIFRKMSAEEKLRVAEKLYWDARKLRAAWLTGQHPDWSEEQVLEAVKKAFLHGNI